MPAVKYVENKSGFSNKVNLYLMFFFFLEQLNEAVTVRSVFSSCGACILYLVLATRNVLLPAFSRDISLVLVIEICTKNYT